MSDSDKSEIDPTTIDFLSDRANKHRRAIITLSVAVLSVAWWLSNLDWSKLPVVGAIDISKSNTLTPAFVMLLVALVYNVAVYNYLRWLEWGEWVHSFIGTNSGEFQELRMYLGRIPIGDLADHHTYKEPWTRSSDGRHITWRAVVPNGTMIVEGADEHVPAFREEVVRVSKRKEQSVRLKYYVDNLALAVALPNVLAASAAAVLIYFMVVPPTLKQPTAEKTPQVIYVGFPQTRPVYQSFPQLPRSETDQ